MDEQLNSGVIERNFGKYLKSIRLEKGFTLEDVAAATHISIDVLTHIESEEIDRILTPVYIKGFLRTISRTIGADGNKAVALYSESLEARNEYERSRHPIRTPHPLRRWGWAAVILLCAIFGGALAYFGTLDEIPAGWRFWESKLQSDKQPAVTKETGSVDKTGETPPEAAPKPGTVVQETAVPKPQPLLLDVRATKDTWMKVIADERQPAEYHLKPGDRLTLEAAARYNLLIGNAGAVQLTLNGKPFPVSGKAGQTVTLQIP